MSTNHTPNYNLCQWEADDKVLREDFNEDNRKIDAALVEASRGQFQIIREDVVTEDTASLTISFPGINWTEWKTFCVNISPGSSSNKNTRIVFENGISLEGWSRQCNQLLFFPMGNPRLLVGGIFLGLKSEVFTTPAYYYNNFHSFELRSTDGAKNISMDTKITVCGERM